MMRHVCDTMKNTLWFGRVRCLCVHGVRMNGPVLIHGVFSVVHSLSRVTGCKIHTFFYPIPEER